MSEEQVAPPAHPLTSRELAIRKRLWRKALSGDEWALAHYVGLRMADAAGAAPFECGCDDCTADVTKDVRFRAKARERAAEHHNEKPPKVPGPRCSATTRKGNPCAMAGSTKSGLCLTHAANAWDRYVARGGVEIGPHQCLSADEVVPAYRVDEDTK